MATPPNPDRLLHAFRTWLGLPPDSDTPPVCGATLTSAYNGRNQPHCPACTAILQAEQPAPAPERSALVACRSCGRERSVAASTAYGVQYCERCAPSS
jgi:hypothetical protein